MSPKIVTSDGVVLFDDGTRIKYLKFHKHNYIVNNKTNTYFALKTPEEILFIDTETKKVIYKFCDRSHDSIVFHKDYPYLLFFVSEVKLNQYLYIFNFITNKLKTIHSTRNSSQKLCYSINDTCVEVSHKYIDINTHINDLGCTSDMFESIFTCAKKNKHPLISLLYPDILQEIKKEF